jgi:hypothetical protein
MARNFGWIPATPEKKLLHKNVYGFSIYLPIVTAAVEKVIPLDPKFMSWYDQDSRNACVGASSSKLMAVMNLGQIGAMQYDWWEHYCWACANDNDSSTSCAADIGTYIWAGMDALRKMGAYVKNLRAWDIEQGIDSYYWCHTVDECRSAIALDRPLEFGLSWYQGWMSPEKNEQTGEYWIPARSKWGKIVGGHAIMSNQASDKKQAFGLCNTWGSDYPEVVYFSYADIEYLLKGTGECAVGIDKNFVPPTPPPATEKEFEVKVDGESYKGMLQKVE